MTTPAHTPTDELAAAFEQTSDEELLTMFARLTHHMHETAAKYAPMPRGCTPGEVAQIRRQRDLVEAEALRRMGGAR